MRFAEFFAGIGLVRLGLEKSGWQCVFANDIDPKKAEMYRACFPGDEEHLVIDDIRNVNPTSIPAVDLATASFPCTDLSLAGGRAGLAGNQSSALWPFIELLHQLETMRPKLVLLENVPGFITSHAGADLKSTLMALTRLSYAVDILQVDAARFVPQSRPRFFIVAKASGQPRSIAERVRLKRFYESDVRPRALADFIFENDDINWSIKEDLPPLPTSGVHISDVLEDLSDLADEWWSEPRVNYLLNQMSDRHREQVNHMLEGDQTTVGTVFRRVRNGKSMAELRTDGIAGCLRTPKGGSGRQIVLFAGRGECRVRLLTPRECARLMGADTFPITVPSNQALFGFGDAVCVPVIDWLAQHYLNPAHRQLSLPATSHAL